MPLVAIESPLGVAVESPLGVRDSGAQLEFAVLIMGGTTQWPGTDNSSKRLFGFDAALNLLWAIDHEELDSLIEGSTPFVRTVKHAVKVAPDGSVYVFVEASGGQVVKFNSGGVYQWTRDASVLGITAILDFDVTHDSGLMLGGQTPTPGNGGVVLAKISGSNVIESQGEISGLPLGDPDGPAIRVRTNPFDGFIYCTLQQGITEAGYKIDPDDYSVQVSSQKFQPIEEFFRDIYECSAVGSDLYGHSPDALDRVGAVGSLFTIQASSSSGAGTALIPAGIESPSELLFVAEVSLVRRRQGASLSSDWSWGAGVLLSTYQMDFNRGLARLIVGARNPSTTWDDNDGSSKDLWLLDVDGNVVASALFGEADLRKWCAARNVKSAPA